MVREINPLDQLKECIENQQSFVLQGGAGSGKTETLKQLSEYISYTYPGKKIACITHTNLAADEIRSRIGDNHTVSTIHSFLHKLIRDYKINIKDVMHEIHLVKKMEPKPFDYYTDEKIRKKQEHENYKKIYSKYVDKLYTVKGENVEGSKGKKEYDKQPEHYNAQLNDQIDKLNNDILEMLEKKDHKLVRYNETRFDNFEELSFGHNSLLEIASLLFDNYPVLRKILRDTYDYIFIDEYQDSNEKIIDLFLKKVSPDNKVTIGLFGDSMQAIYEEGIGDVDQYIFNGTLKEVIKEDNFRCSEQIVDFINKLRVDQLKQEVALKAGKFNTTKETLEDRQGTLKLYCSIYESKKPTSRSSEEDKEKYQAALNQLIKKAVGDQENYKILMLTNKSIARDAGFGNLYNIFARVYSETVEEMEKHFMQLQLLDLFEVCQAFEEENYNFLLHKLKMLGFSIKSVMEKELLSQSISKVQHSKESIMETLEYAFDCGLLNKAERHLEYINRRALFLKELDEDPRYSKFKSLFNNGLNTSSKMMEETTQFTKKEFERLKTKMKKEEFYYQLFSKKLTFKEIINFYRYLNEDGKYLTMHKTKGTGIENVIVGLEEFFWTKYDFKTIFYPGEEDEKKKLKNQKLFYVACSRAIKNLTCVRLVSSEEEKEMLEGFFEKDLVLTST